MVDDHPGVREGLASMLAGYDDVDVVGAAGDGATAVALTATCMPDVVLMDLAMPVLDGLGATRLICSAMPGVRVVILTSFATDDRVREAVDAGAAGYLLKDAEPAELVASLRAAARGEAPFSPRAATALLPGAPTLSDRQRQVLSLVAGGLANKAIAAELGISERTVEAHITGVFTRIGVNDRRSATHWATEHGLCSESSSG